MKTRVLNIQQAFAEIPEYFRDYDVHDYDDLYKWFEGDPDMLKLPGTIYDDDVVVTFDNFEYKNTQYVVYEDVVYEGDDSRIEPILTDFFSEDWKDKFEKLESNWNNFYPGTIAYRGGSGYTYTIWKIKNMPV